PRVPSFYSLEALRAAEGQLPGFRELGARAETRAHARLGWPAPAAPVDAIDEAEYDLALLAPLLDADPDTTAGTATYLLTPHPSHAHAPPAAAGGRPRRPLAKPLAPGRRPRRPRRAGARRPPPPPAGGALLLTPRASALRRLPVPLLPAGGPPPVAT